jgi:hypothetical protein
MKAKDNAAPEVITTKAIPSQQKPSELCIKISVPPTDTIPPMEKGPPEGYKGDH